MCMAFCSTGQKYIYTGSSDSSVYIYDLVCTLFLSIPPPLLYQYHDSLVTFHLEVMLWLRELQNVILLF
jgi:hypothetical protein